MSAIEDREDKKFLRAAPQALLRPRGRAMLRRIEDATYRLLISEPSSSFTVERVASEVGASVGTVYRYFQDKDDLARAVHNEIAARLDEELQSRLQLAGPGVEAVVTALTYGVCDWMTKHWQAMRTLILERPMDQVIQARELATIQKVQTVLSAALECEEDRAAHSDLQRASKLAHSFIFGPFMITALSPEQEDLHALCDDIIRTCLCYLCGSRPPMRAADEIG